MCSGAKLTIGALPKEIMVNIFYPVPSPQEPVQCLSHVGLILNRCWIFDRFTRVVWFGSTDEDRLKWVTFQNVLRRPARSAVQQPKHVRIKTGRSVTEA